MLVPAMVMAQAPSTTHFQVLHAFNGSNGDSGFGSLILDAAGNMYGATLVGGDLNCVYSGLGCGVVFELSATGEEKILHKFKGSPDGALPMWGGNLTLDSQGNLYGLTNNGGVVACPGNGDGACGTVFKIDSTGHETVIYAFKGTNGDGNSPYGNVILDKSGNLYGTTSLGGTYNNGTVFKIDTTGKETVLHSFAGSPDGAFPSGLVEDAAGNLYGATIEGGIAASGGPCGSFGCGTVFKLTKTGQETVLYRFTNSNGDGENPFTTLVLDKKGNLYGTTQTGGISSCAQVADECGIVFKVSQAGHETILYQFKGSPDGRQPFGPVVFDAAGNLYGATYWGGTGTECGTQVGCGTVFKLTKGGKETVLHSFSGGKDGGVPFFGVAIDGAGNLYGTTQEGGNPKCQNNFGSGCGVVYKITQ